MLFCEEDSLVVDNTEVFMMKVMPLSPEIIWKMNIDANDFAKCPIESRWCKEGLMTKIMKLYEKTYCIQGMKSPSEEL